MKSLTIKRLIICLSIIFLSKNFAQSIELSKYTYEKVKFNLRGDKNYEKRKQDNTGTTSDSQVKTTDNTSTQSNQDSTIIQNVQPQVSTSTNSVDNLPAINNTIQTDKTVNNNPQVQPVQPNPSPIPTPPPMPTPVQPTTPVEPVQPKQPTPSPIPTPPPMPTPVQPVQPVQPNPSPIAPEPKFEPVTYVPQLSAAGKAAIDLQNSGE